MYKIRGTGPLFCNVPLILYDFRVLKLQNKGPPTVVRFADNVLQYLMSVTVLHFLIDWIEGFHITVILDDYPLAARVWTKKLPSQGRLTSKYGRADADFTVKITMTVDPHNSGNEKSCQNYNSEQVFTPWECNFLGAMRRVIVILYYYRTILRCKRKLDPFCGKKISH